MAEDGLKGRIAPLAQRLLSRRERMTRATGLTVARSVADRRRPATLEPSIRLALGRTIVAREPAQPEPEHEPIKLPEYMSPLAAEILFGDESLADVEAYEKYQARQDAKAEAFATGAGFRRGTVLEGPGGGGDAPQQFRLSRTPGGTPVDLIGTAALSTSEESPSSAAAEQEPPTAESTLDAGGDGAPVSEPQEATATPESAEPETAPEEPAQLSRISRTPVKLDIKETQEERRQRPVIARHPAGDGPHEHHEEEEAGAPAAAAPATEATPEAPEAARPAPVPIELVEQPDDESAAPEQLISRTPAEPAPATEAPSAPSVVESSAEAAPTAEEPAQPSVEAAPSTDDSAPPDASTDVVTPEAPHPPVPVVARAVEDRTPQEPPRVSAEPPAPAVEPARPTVAPLARTPAHDAPGTAEPGPGPAEAPAPASRPAPVPVRQIARAEAPRRAVVQPRPVEPPPIVEVAPPSPEADVPAAATAPAAPAPTPTRGIFRRIADVFRGPQVEPGPIELDLGAETEPPAEAPQSGERAPAGASDAPAPAVVTPASSPAPAPGPTIARAPAPAPEESPDPEPEVHEPMVLPGPAAQPKGLRAAVSKLFRQPVADDARGGADPASSSDAGRAGFRGAQPTTPVGSARVSRSAESGPAVMRTPAVPRQADVHGGAEAPISTPPLGGARPSESPAPVAGPAPRSEAAATAALAGGPVIARRTAAPDRAGVARSAVPGPTATVAEVGAVTESATSPAGNAQPGTARAGFAARAPARVARVAAERPAPVPVENLRVQPASPVLARAPQSAAGGPLEPVGEGPSSSALALAAATGGTISRSAADLSTVMFPTPFGEYAGAVSEPSIARALDEAPAPSPTPPPEAGGGGEGGDKKGGGDVDEITEKVIEKIKDLALWERERMGDLTGDLP